MTTPNSNQSVPIKGRFETHLTVSDLQRSIDFYRDKLGLQLALKVSDRNAAFFWIGDSRRSMLGLWSIGSAPLGLTLHIAFDVNIRDLLPQSFFPKAFKSSGNFTLNFLR
jgi:lactoylglutathione lyase